MKLTKDQFLKAIEAEGSKQLDRIRPTRDGHEMQWILFLESGPHITAWIESNSTWGWCIDYGVTVFPAKQITKTVHEWVMA